MFVFLSICYFVRMFIFFFPFFFLNIYTIAAVVDDAAFVHATMQIKSKKILRS